MDGRSRLARRAADLYRSFLAATDYATITDVQVAACRRAAELLALAEKSRHDMMRGEPVDCDALIRLELTADRAMRRLPKAARKITPTFSEIVAKRAKITPRPEAKA